MLKYSVLFPNSVDSNLLEFILFENLCIGETASGEAIFKQDVKKNFNFKRDAHQNGTLISILYMDDEKTLRLVVRLMLERLGYAVETAEEGRKALTAYKARMQTGSPFDIVILDINIEEGMGGVETLENLLKLEPQVKVIGASGSVTPETLKGLLKMGFSSVLAKPFRLEQLQKAIEQVLNSPH